MKWLLKRGLKFILTIGTLALVLFLVFGPGYVERSKNVVLAHDPYPVSDAAMALHNSLTIGDLHADSLLWNRDLNKRGAYGQVDIPRLIEGNVALQVFTAVTKSPAGLNYNRNSADARDNITLLAMAQLWPARTWQSIYERAVYMAQRLHGFQAAAPDRLKIILTAADLDALLARRANGDRTVGAILGIEGSHPLEGKLENLQNLVDEGYRLIALQHFFDNELGGSLHGESGAGLTDFGRQVVVQVAERPLILDLAHSSPQVVRDVLDMTDIPLVVSHTGIHSHCQTKRNIPDALMVEIANRGGVIGIGFWEEAVCDITPAGIAGAIVAAVNLLGEDHVALGSDFDGSVTTRFDVSELAALTQALLDAGLTAPTIRKVMGENMVRLVRARLSAN